MLLTIQTNSTWSTANSNTNVKVNQKLPSMVSLHESKEVRTYCTQARPLARLPCQNIFVSIATALPLKTVNKQLTNKKLWRCNHVPLRTFLRSKNHLVGRFQPGAVHNTRDNLPHTSIEVYNVLSFNSGSRRQVLIDKFFGIKMFYNTSNCATTAALDNEQ